MRRLRPSLTPMIDVVFLLLLFFLLSTQLSTPQSVALAASDAGAGEGGPEIDLLEIGDEVRWNNVIVSVGELDVAAAENPERAVAIRADDSVSVQSLIEHVDAMRNAGRGDIILVARGTE